MISSPIHASSRRKAEEILYRTYKRDAYVLKLYRRIDFGKIWFGSRFAFQFEIERRKNARKVP